MAQEKRQVEIGLITKFDNRNLFKSHFTSGKVTVKNVTEFSIYYEVVDLFF